MISSCFEVVGTLGWREGSEQNGDFLPERLDGAMGSLSKQRLELGEELFNGIEIGGVRRQITQAGTDGCNGGLDPGDLVTGQVIGHDDVARAEGGTKAFFDIGQEGFAVHGTVEQQRGGESIDTQAGHEGSGFPVLMRYGGDAALAFWRTAVGAGHVGTGTGFIQKHQLGDIKHGLACPPLLPRGLHVLAFLLAGVQSFF